MGTLYTGSSGGLTRGGCFKRHSLPGPPAQAGPVRCIILPYLRYYRTYAYTYKGICNVLSGTVWHAVCRLRNVRWPASSGVQVF